jgi:chromosome segregation ATPase
MDSELSDTDFLSGASNPESHESSHSDNFVRTWPDTHAQTYRVLQDAQLDTKKAQLERHRAELEATVLAREVGLQAEIREAAGSVNDLRIEISNHEAALSQIIETRNADVLEIRKRLMNRLKKYEGVMLTTDRTIREMKEAIRAQREAHEKRKAALLQGCADEAGEADARIEALTKEIEAVRGQANEILQKSDADLLDAQATIEHLQSELTGLADESANVDGQFAELSQELAGLKRDLIIAEEEGASVKNQIEFNSRLRAQIRGAIDRTKKQQWEIASRNFYVLD